MTTKQLIRTLLVSCVLCSAGCTSKLKYDSHPDTERLRALHNKPVVILQFDYKDDVLVDDVPLDGSLGDKVAAQQKASFMSQFGSLFILKDVSKNVAVRYGKLTDFGDPAIAGRVLQDFGGDGGFVISTAYGYKMAGGSMKDRITEEGLKKVLPNKVVGILTGPSQVQSYDFASRTILLNREGQVVWSFYGKASALPTFATMFNPTEFARSVAGLDPSVQNLTLKSIQISDGYNQYLAWMMQQDMNGIRAKNYFHDYPPDRKSKNLTVFPAETKTYVPFVKGYGPLE